MCTVCHIVVQICMCMCVCVSVLHVLIINPWIHVIGAVALKTLGTREVRSKWEEQFGRFYIHPLLEVYPYHVISHE